MKNELGRLVIASVSLVYANALFSSCSSTPGSVGGSSDNPTAGTAGTTVILTGQGGRVSGGGGAKDPSAAGTCGTTTNDTTRALADILIVLDHSESMTWSISSDDTCTGAGCTTRLAAVVSGVESVVANNTGIHWGLELFTTPNAASCTVDPAPQVAIAADNAATIKQVLDGVTTKQTTPTAAALTVATNYLKTVNDGNNKAILLATDGLPNCGGGLSSASDMPGATAAATAAFKAGFPVYVIGIGPSTSISNLNTLAQVGGTSNYYSATSPQELNSALATIAKTVSATCTFKANTTPPDKNLVWVYVDKNLVAESASNGWKFDPSDATGATIVLTGSTCNDLLAGKTSQVQIVFGCVNQDPPSFIP